MVGWYAITEVCVHRYVGCLKRLEKWLNSPVQPTGLKNILLTFQCFHRIAEWLGLEGTSGDRLVQDFLWGGGEKKRMKVSLLSHPASLSSPLAVEVWRPALQQAACCSPGVHTAGCKYSGALDGTPSTGQVSYSRLTREGGTTSN